MKSQVSCRPYLHLFLITLLSVIAGLMNGPSVHAGLTFDLRLIREQQGQSYNFYAEFETNSTLPAAALGTYLVNSPQQPTNGSWRQLELTTNGFNFIGGGSGIFSDFDSVMDQITNGNWTIVFTNATTTNYFQFTVSAPSMTSNMLPALVVTLPTEGATLPTTHPTFTWQWPDSWGVNSDAFVFNNSYSFFQYASLPELQHTWFMATPLPVGENLHVQLRYTTNHPTPVFVATTPLNTNSAQPISGWISASGLTSIENVDFSVSNSPSGGNTNLFGHYTFDDEFDLKNDSSGLNHDAVNEFYTGSGTQFPQYTAVGIAGGAVEFDGFNAFWWETNLVNVLSDSYTISLWLKTTQSLGNDNDDARDGAAIFAGNDSGDFPVPMALTGDKLGFYTAVPDHTINSGNSINSGNFTHLVVTRDAATGMKHIYVDGMLDVSGTGGTAAGIASTEVYLGYSYYNGQGIVGVVDDLQVYTSVLSSNQIDFLYQNPGTTAPPDSESSGGHTNLAHYRFDEDLGHDDSGNENNFTSGSSWGFPLHEYDPVGAAGAGGVRFYGESSMTHEPPNESFTNITTATADSFSLSLWIKTETVVGNDTDDALNGAVVVWQYESGTDDIIPVSITGNKVAFHTGDELGNSQTLHSTNDVTDGNYHHIVVTRDRPTGVKKIYVDGVLEATEPATTRVLNANDHYFSIGGVLGHSFDGTVDDVQIYSGVLSASEVTNLYNNPGDVIPDTTSDGGPTNITADLILSIFRIQPPGNPEFFLCYPFSSITPTPLTTHEVHSPNGLFTSSNGQPTSSGVASLGQLLDEITNGVWTIYFNKNHPSEQQFTFSVSAAGVTTNLLQKVTILSPANGSTSVPSVPTYSWSGASGLDNLSVALYQTNYLVGSTNPPSTATTWINPPPLAAGTNQLDVTYFSIGVTNFSFTMPVDSNSVPLSSWTTRADLQSQATSFFVVGSGITPVQLANPNHTGGNFQFQFLSQSGKTNTVQSRTNLALGVWVDRTNILGDGTTMTVILPFSNAPTEFFRISTQ